MLSRSSGRPEEVEGTLSKIRVDIRRVKVEETSSEARRHRGSRGALDPLLLLEHLFAACAGSQTVEPRFSHPGRATLEPSRDLASFQKFRNFRHSRLLRRDLPSCSWSRRSWSRLNSPRTLRSKPATRLLRNKASSRRLFAADVKPIFPIVSEGIS